MTNKTTRIRRRNGETWSASLGGALFLAITSTTSMIGITAFPIQHPLSHSSITTTHPTTSELNYHRKRYQQNRRSFARIFGRSTFLMAEVEPGTNGDGELGNIKSSIAASIDSAGIASLDPEYQKYKESMRLVEEEEDEAFFKDFVNSEFTPLMERDASSSMVVPATPKPKPTPVKEKERMIAEEKKEGETEKERQLQKPAVRPAVADTSVHLRALDGFNVVLTHCTADFDSLASAVGLAKLWTNTNKPDDSSDGKNGDVEDEDEGYDSAFDNYPTFVVLPRGAHPAVQRFLALHKHLFPIRSLKSLPSDLSKLHRLALVDAQRKERIGPADVLLQHANRVTVVDHHVDQDSDIPGITDYVVDQVGSVSTLIVERLMKQQEKQLEAQLESSSSPINTLTEAEATLLALGIHADTGSLCFDSTTPRDAAALAWVMAQGASQIAIAEHAQSSLSSEQQKVLTQALVNTNSTVAHGVTISTVLLTADGFINGLAAVTQDALELSSADVFLLGVVYEPKSGRKSKGSRAPGNNVKSKLLMTGTAKAEAKAKAEAEAKAKEMASFPMKALSPSGLYKSKLTVALEEKRLAEESLRASFDKKDLDGDGLIDQKELTAALVASGIVATEETVRGLMESIDMNKDGVVDFDEFVAFASTVKTMTQIQQETDSNATSVAAPPSPPSTLIIIGRAKPGVNMKSVKLGKLLEKYGGGGHPKAASATVRLNDESEAADIMSGLVDELIDTSLREQSTVGDFMTSPVLSVKSDMSEHQVEDLFTRYDVRALPVVNEENEVIGLVTYKEVAAAKQRMWNKEQKRLRQEQQRKEQGGKQKNKKKKGKGKKNNDDENLSPEELEKKRKQQQITEAKRRRGPTVKAWMKQHIKTVEASLTMAEVEAILLENDVGCIPVVQDGTEKLVGMVTRTDLLRQHRYYPSLHYNNKGMSDSIASRKPIIALRRKLKQFDLDE
eukprot:CAMPEP_0172377768 /NCGR_PEP_ID=MMETSP1060-20121228/69080_1 /TAXON_ID=37318 /ORGANISM="Pseudo-nitzschia pungens, Strain cf. cingulata" /LENGTH=958 /DNA_ID=CAMNT_0013105477 /DNA_START=165 /DNA_END=3041 /DNA_ORIENTATION=+